MIIPPYYTPERLGHIYAPDVLAATEAGYAAGFTPASQDTFRVYLLLVDEQIDFIHLDGSLAVPGAIDDTLRIVNWMYQHANIITGIGASLDSHIPIQIFSPTWWVNEAGEHPAPYTAISSDDIQSGTWKPLYEMDWSTQYVEQLEEHAKKLLMIWPYHTLIGTTGHALVPAIYEALAYHTAARGVQPTMLIKGTIPQTEHYSIMEPEVKVADDPLGQLNTALLDAIGQYDLIYVAGQAKSHCVLETVASMVHYYPPETIAKIRVLEDTMSSVRHPEIDFDALANEAFARFETHGLKRVTTDDPIG